MNQELKRDVKGRFVKGTAGRKKGKKNLQPNSKEIREYYDGCQEMLIQSNIEICNILTECVDLAKFKKDLPKRTDISVFSKLTIQGFIKASENGNIAWLKYYQERFLGKPEPKKLITEDDSTWLFKVDIIDDKDTNSIEKKNKELKKQEAYTKEIKSFQPTERSRKYREV